ncbi:MAG: hypothetical protein V3V31_01365 [Methylococcales bacterium]
MGQKDESVAEVIQCRFSILGQPPSMLIPEIIDQEVELAKALTNLYIGAVSKTFF